MPSFIHNVAQLIYDERIDSKRNKPGDTIVVFNNRRAGLFLQHELQSLEKPEKKVFFLPEIIGIDDLVARLGGLRIVPHEFLLFELYDIHRSLGNTEHKFETFEEFMSFGEIMLTDFSEIDLYRVDAVKLFNNLHDLKELGEWDISGTKPTKFQEQYLNFYRSLQIYYNGLRSRLKEKGMAYSGMAYRHVADNIDSLIGSLFPPEKQGYIYFVGFNALSKSEEKIIDCCVQRGLGRLICDGDDYYFSDTRQEAGLFLRKNAEKYNNIGPFYKEFEKKEKNIHIIDCPEEVLQTKTAGKIIASNLTNDNAKTAIVLADEDLLMPMLNSLPPNVGETNITMGFPYILSNTNNLCTKLLNLCCNSRNGRFYHADITAILSDPIIALLTGSSDLHSIITHRINEEKTIYATPSDIERLTEGIPGCDKALFLFSTPTPDAGQTLAIIRQLVETLTSNDTLQDNVREKEALACLLQIIDYLEELQSTYNILQKTETLQKIYKRLASRRTVALYGKPLHGLQILGMLETRNLDFSRLMILSLNEEILPAGRKNNSLIPFALKTSFSLPTHRENDAVYAYNFYRLIQRADEVWLLYSSHSDGVDKGEPSRYILQIKNELAIRCPNIKIHEHVVSPVSSQTPTINIAPNNHVPNYLQRIQEVAKKGFSPSALNNYRNCPLKFYYEDLLGAHKQENLNEDIENNELGTLIHLVLNNIYSIDKNKKTNIKTLSSALTNIDTIIENTFSQKILKGRKNEGKNKLYCEVAKMQITHFLKQEIKLLESGNTIQIITLEQPLKVTLPQKDIDCGFPVNIQGISDRIDCYNGQLRITDYKSGEVTSDDLKVSNDPSKESEPPVTDYPDKWFQVMTYAWMYCRANNYNGDFISGIFPLRSLDNGFTPASWHGEMVLNSNDINRFETILTTLAKQIIDPNVPFDPTPSKKACGYCPYSLICPAIKNKSAKNSSV
ncbi:MAG: PD-(D/E)XK nuclease family protein [Bacteroidales bacterium]|nr:PD-(D/E)XK nuclease family protein [Bacteroidales bacterium]